MGEDRSEIAAAVTSILAEMSDPETVRRDEDHGWNAELWAVMSETGFTHISIPEEAGGSGGDLADACEVVKAVGRFAAAIPVVETGLLAGWALAAAGLEIPPGPATVSVGANADVIELGNRGGSWRLNGRLHRVPWAQQSERIVVIAAAEGVDHVVSLRTGDLNVRPGRNLAGESRDTVILDDVSVDAVAPAPAGVDGEALRLRGALGRAVMMAGALSRVSALTVQYTGVREQFGRPLARFQAVQRHIVHIAERSQAAGIAVETAYLNAAPNPDFFDVAAAKIVAGEAASLAVAASHQAHGAIGMTKEYELGQLSRRLWAWRDEFGSEASWSQLLGHRVAEAGPDKLWPRVAVGRVSPASSPSEN